MATNMPYNMKAETDTKKKKKKSSKRCCYASCRKKLKLTDYECRCGKRYCQLHRLPELHMCNVDYKTLNQEAFIQKAGLIL